MNNPPPDDPLVYLLRQNGKHMAICLSSIGKWVAGILATVIGSAIIGISTFAFWSVSTISRIESTLIYTASTVSELDKKVSLETQENKRKREQLDNRVRELEKGKS